MDKGDWQTTVHRVTKSQTQMKRLSAHTQTHTHTDTHTETHTDTHTVRDG